MKKKTLWSVLALILSVALFASCGPDEHEGHEGQLWTCGMHPDVILEEPGMCPICEMNLVPVKQGSMPGGGDSSANHRMEMEGGRKILYWRAPMDPTYVSDKPGKSPMGMDLIPVYEGDNQAMGGKTVTIDPVTVQNIGVQTVRVKLMDLSRVVRTVGHVDYDEERIHRVNLKFSGWIEVLHVDQTGQQVTKGDPLFEIYSPEMVTTQEEYLIAYKNVVSLAESPFEDVSLGSRSLLEAARRRLLNWDLTEEQIRDLEQTGTVRKTVTLYSPVNGVVISKDAEQGMRVRKGVDLYRIADLSTLWVYAHIYEYEVPWIRVGQPVEMDLPYIPGRVFTGEVDYVYPYLDQENRDIKVRIVFTNPGLELKPMMYANVRLESQLGKEVAVVPGEAVIRSGKRNVLFVARGEGKFEPRDVVLGPEGEDGLIQVIRGVDIGEEVVTSAQFLIDSESRLREAIQKMLESRSSIQQSRSSIQQVNE